LKSEKQAKLNINEEICGFASLFMKYAEMVENEFQIFAKGKMNVFFIVVGRVHCTSA